MGPAPKVLMRSDERMVPCATAVVGASVGEMPPSHRADPNDRLSTSAAVAEETTKLLHHSSHYLAGLVAKLALGFISLPIFTRVFSVADYGLIDLAQKILLFFTAVSKMGLQNSALRFFDGKAFASQSHSKGRYYSTMFVGSLSTAAVVAIFILAASRYFLKSIIDTPLSALMNFVCLLLVLRAIESMFWSFMRAEERTKAYNFSSVALKASTILTVCLLLPWTGRTPRTFFLGTTAVELAFVAIMSFLLFRRGTLNPARFDPALFKTALVFGGPLVVYEAASSFLDSGDRLLVRHFLGPEALGLYSVAYGLSAQGNELLILPLNLAVFPIYMRLWKSKGREATAAFLSTCLDLYLAAAAGVWAIAAVTSKDALVLLASTKYASAAHLIPLVAAGLLIYTTHVFLCAGLLIYKRTGTMACLLLFSSALNIGLNWLLLPRMGLMAAAIATLVGYVLCILLLGLASVRMLPVDIRFRALGRYLLAAGIVSYAVSRIELTSPARNVAAKSALVAVSYCVLLYMMDPRVRSASARGLRSLTRRTHLPSVARETIAPPS